MKSYIEFVCTPTADTPGTLVYFHFDDKRYLVGNMSEGTNRAQTQQNFGFRRVSHVLLSGRLEWQSIGGLLGAVLSIADAQIATQQSQPTDAKAAKDQSKADGGKTLTFFGPPNLNYTLATARRFIFRQGMPIQAIEFRAFDPAFAPAEQRKPSFVDDRIKAWALPIVPEEATASKPDPQLDIYQSVVHDMFDSDWRYDRLYPCTASELTDSSSRAFVRDPDTKDLVPYKGPRGAEVRKLGSAVEDVEVWQRQPWPGAQHVDLPVPLRASESISYIIRTHGTRGKFLPNEAKKLKVKPGRDYTRLTQGQSVVTEEGATVTPEMVMAPPNPGNGFAFIDLPSAGYIAPLLQRPEWEDPAIMEGCGAMIWALGPTLASDPRIVAFQAQHSSIKHIIAAPDVSPDDFVIESSLKAVLRQNKICPEAYPILQADPRKRGLTTSFPTETTTEDPVINTVKAQRRLRLVIEPRLTLEANDIPPPFTEQSLQHIVQDDLALLGADFDPPIEPDFVASKAKWESDFEYPDAEVICLGTGSSHPVPHRNVSSTLVRVPGDGSYLFDAGEGTLGSLRRLYSPEQLDNVLKDLKAIWISHLHADHHLGTASVIKAWYKAVHQCVPAVGAEADLNTSSQRLVIASHDGMLKWLQEYARVEDFGLSRLLLVRQTPAFRKLFWPRTKGSSSPSPGRSSPGPAERHGSDSDDVDDDPAIHKVLERMGLESIASTYVQHCKGAQAVTLTTKSGFKVSYSGDCRPSANFVKIGKGSHVLIHEATFEEDMLGEARAKKHSTAGEALAVGVDMGAKVCVLTHFSQRYPKMASMAFMGKGKNGDAIQEATQVAFNNAPVGVEMAIDDHAKTKSPVEPAAGGENAPVDVDMADRGGLDAAVASKEGLDASADANTTAAPKEAPVDTEMETEMEVYLQADADAAGVDGDGEGDGEGEGEGDGDGIPMIEDPNGAPKAGQESWSSFDKHQTTYNKMVRNGQVQEVLAESGMRVVMAFDFLQFRLRHVPELERRQPVLRLLYDRLAARDENEQRERAAEIDKQEQKRKEEREKEKLEKSKSCLSKRDRKDKAKAEQAKRAKLEPQA